MKNELKKFQVLGNTTVNGDALSVLIFWPGRWELCISLEYVEAVLPCIANSIKALTMGKLFKMRESLILVMGNGNLWPKMASKRERSCSCPW